MEVSIFTNLSLYINYAQYLVNFWFCIKNTKRLLYVKESKKALELDIVLSTTWNHKRQRTDIKAGKEWFYPPNPVFNGELGNPVSFYQRSIHITRYDLSYGITPTCPSCSKLDGVQKHGTWSIRKIFADDDWIYECSYRFRCVYCEVSLFFQDRTYLY